MKYLLRYSDTALQDIKNLRFVGSARFPVMIFICGLLIKGLSCVENIIHPLHETMDEKKLYTE